MVVLMMIVPTQHHQMVLSQGNLRRIMDQTSSRIQVDQRSRNGLTKVSIQGTVTNVLQCRLQLIGCFPLVLMFDIGDGNQEIDSDKLDRFLAGLKQKYDVFASVIQTQTHPTCLLYTSPSPRDRQKSRMPSSA